MADGHFTDVELLRRELAALILEWAGKAVKDDPDGPMSTALTRAVGEAARNAVVDQHQALTAETADRIAEALDRRGKAGVLSAPVWIVALLAVAALALATITFFVGLQVGRSDIASTPTTASAGVNAPVAPLAPTVEDPAPTRAAPRPAEIQPAHRVQRATPAPARPAARSAPRDLGRPAPTGEGVTPSSAQPVGAAPTPAAPVATPKP